jgi:hypothetical protein
VSSSGRGCQLFARCFAAGGFLCRLFGAGHGWWIGWWLL